MSNTTKWTNNIVLACENEDAHGLVHGVNEAILSKLVDKIEEKQREIAKGLFESLSISEEGTDPYVSLDANVQEAVDAVVESMLEEEDKDLEEEINRIAKDKNVSEAAVREYFEQVCGGIAEDKKADTKETGQTDDNGDRMNDEDEVRRVQYEQFIGGLKNGGVIVYNNNTRYLVTPEQGQALHTVFENLSLENQEKMVQKLQESRNSFLGVMEFSLRMVSEN